MPTLYEEVRAALHETEFKPRKRLGQNFLIHEAVIDAILRVLNLQSHDSVLEIGPGLGFLTRRLVSRAARVWAVEVDPFLTRRLQGSELASVPSFQLIFGDILKVPLTDFLPAERIKLVGNLPYSISTPVLFRIFELQEHFSLVVLMVQKEVADRIASGPGTKAYGTLSVLCRVYGEIVDKIQVAPEAFYPRPKVRSTVLKINLYPVPRVPYPQLPILRSLLRAAFGQRRKTLSNAVTAWLKADRRDTEQFLRSQGVDPQRRGETLSCEEFIRLTMALNSSSLLRMSRGAEFHA